MAFHPAITNKKKYVSFMDTSAARTKAEKLLTKVWFKLREKKRVAADLATGSRVQTPPSAPSLNREFEHRPD